MTAADDRVAAIQARADDPTQSPGPWRDDLRFLINRLHELEGMERRWLALVATLERALNEGRNVVPDATDDEAHAVESFALSLLGQVASGTLEQSADA